ncbi:MAG: hypothetical protein ABSF38_16210 [Verrucomicrobiota bacterium]
MRWFSIHAIRETFADYDRHPDVHLVNDTVQPFAPSQADTTREPCATFKTYLPKVEPPAKILDGQ